MKWPHGGDIYRNKIKYDFSANINPLGMPEGCLAAAIEGAENCWHYPDGYNENLYNALAGKESVKSEQLLLGNGAAEIIYTICHAIRPEKVLIPIPSFLEYANAAKAVDAEIIYHALAGEDYQLEFNDDLKMKIDSSDLMFLCNPNNPTGGIIDKEVMLQIADFCESAGTILCIDECFLPFLENEDVLSMKTLLDKYKGLVILRAFTKVYGMPGLRLGYMMCANNKLLGKCKDNLPPWNISLPAQMAGERALRDASFLEKSRSYIVKERDFLISNLEKQIEKGIIKKIYPAYANYIFFEIKEKQDNEIDNNAEDFYQKMLNQGILVRDCSNYLGLRKGYYRICVNTHEANEYFIQVVSSLR